MFMMMGKTTRQTKDVSAASALEDTQR